MAYQLGTQAPPQLPSSWINSSFSRYIGGNAQQSTFTTPESQPAIPFRGNPPSSGIPRRQVKKIPWRALAAASIVAAGFCFVVAVYFVGLSDKNAADRDYIGYWAAGQQLAHGANPYDSAATLQLERAVGYMGDRPRLTPSPPVALLLVLPLGYFSAKNGLILWLVLQIACLSISIWILWLLHGRPTTRLHLFG